MGKIYRMTILCILFINIVSALGKQHHKEEENYFIEYWDFLNILFTSHRNSASDGFHSKTIYQDGDDDDKPDLFKKTLENGEESKNTMICRIECKILNSFLGIKCNRLCDKVHKGQPRQWRT